MAKKPPRIKTDTPAYEKLTVLVMGVDGELYERYVNGITINNGACSFHIDIDMESRDDMLFVPDAKVYDHELKKISTDLSTNVQNSDSSFLMLYTFLGQHNNGDSKRFLKSMLEKQHGIHVDDVYLNNLRLYYWDNSTLSASVQTMTVRQYEMYISYDHVIHIHDHSSSQIMACAVSDDVFYYNGRAYYKSKELCEKKNIPAIHWLDKSEQQTQTQTQTQANPIY